MVIIVTNVLKTYYYFQFFRLNFGQSFDQLVVYCRILMGYYTDTFYMETTSYLRHPKNLLTGEHRRT